MATKTPAKITLDRICADSTEYTLKLRDGDRVRIEANGKYVAYIRCANGTVTYPSSGRIVTL